jgi:hypothetical protein
MTQIASGGVERGVRFGVKSRQFGCPSVGIFYAHRYHQDKRRFLARQNARTEFVCIGTMAVGESANNSTTLDALSRIDPASL